MVQEGEKLSMAPSPLVVALAVAIVTTLLFLAVQRASGGRVWLSNSLASGGGPGNRNVVLMLGAKDAGKTTLFSMLRYGACHGTFTSMLENVGDVATGAGLKPLRLVDMPGHGKLRYLMDDAERQRTLWGGKLHVKTILFVVDASTVARVVDDVVERLYDALYYAYEAKIPEFVLVVNKTELFTAMAAPKLVSRLQQELTQLVRTRQRLGSVIGSGGGAGVADTISERESAEWLLLPDDKEASLDLLQLPLPQTSVRVVKTSSFRQSREQLTGSLFAEAALKTSI